MIYKIRVPVWFIIERHLEPDEDSLVAKKTAAKSAEDDVDILLHYIRDKHLARSRGVRRADRGPAEVSGPVTEVFL